MKNTETVIRLMYVPWIIIDGDCKTGNSYAK